MVKEVPNIPNRVDFSNPVEMTRLVQLIKNSIKELAIAHNVLEKKVKEIQNGNT